MNRRAFIATVGIGGVGVTAGCLGSLVDELTTFTATPAAVSEATLEETGYVHDETNERVETESVAGETVEMTSYVNEYSRTIDLAALGLESIEAGQFGTIATPQVEVAGEDYNPVGDMGPDELLGLVQDQYEMLSIDSDALVDERSTETLSQSVTVSTYEGTASIGDGESVAVFVDLSHPDHGGDHLVFVAAYPQTFSNENGRVDTLIEGVTHDS